jgi:hypothetical protein
VHILDDFAGVIGVAGNEGLGCDVEAKELGVDGVEDRGDEGGDERRGRAEDFRIGCSKVEEVGEVGDALGKGTGGGEGGGGDMLHGNGLVWFGEVGGVCWRGMVEIDYEDGDKGLLTRDRMRCMSEKGRELRDDNERDI